MLVPLMRKRTQVRPQKAEVIMKIRPHTPRLVARSNNITNKVVCTKALKPDLLCYKVAVTLLPLQHQPPKLMLSIMRQKSRMKENEKLNLSTNKKK